MAFFDILFPAPIAFLRPAFPTLFLHSFKKYSNIALQRSYHLEWIRYQFCLLWKHAPVLP